MALVCRNADYGLIRITFANVIEHALIRNKEYFKELKVLSMFFPKSFSLNLYLFSIRYQTNYKIQLIFYYYLYIKDTCYEKILKKRIV